MTEKPRRPPNLTEKVAILTRQALCGCGCGQKLAGRRIEYHHMHERALGGADAVDNWTALVADDKGERNCHGIVTNGTKATTAGSSKHKIAKADRLEKARLAMAGSEAPKPPPELTEKFKAITSLEKAKTHTGTGVADDDAMLIPKRRGYSMLSKQSKKGRH